MPAPRGPTPTRHQLRQAAAALEMYARRDAGTWAGRRDALAAVSGWLYDLVNLVTAEPTIGTTPTVAAPAEPTTVMTTAVASPAGATGCMTHAVACMTKATVEPSSTVGCITHPTATPTVAVAAVSAATAETSSVIAQPRHGGAAEKPAESGLCAVCLRPVEVCDGKTCQPEGAEHPLAALGRTLARQVTMCDGADEQWETWNYSPYINAWAQLAYRLRVTEHPQFTRAEAQMFVAAYRDELRASYMADARRLCDDGHIDRLAYIEAAWRFDARLPTEAEDEELYEAYCRE